MEESKVKPQELKKQPITEKFEVINDYDIVQQKQGDEDEVPNQDILLTTPQEPIARPRIYHEHSSRISENGQDNTKENEKEPESVQPVKEKLHKRPVIETSEEKVSKPQDDTPIPKQLGHGSEEKKSNIRPRGNIEIPMSPIEEQLARNEDSKESLPNLP